MQSLWSGCINLGAMNVPIKLYTATTDTSGKAVALKTLHRRCRAPVNQVKRCSACGDDIRGAHETVSGYEYAKGKYALVKKDELPKPESDEKGVLAVEDFVPARELDVFSFDRHYWAVPDGAVKSFALLHRVLLQTGHAAVVRFTLRSKSHLALVYPRGQWLMVTTLYYAHEIRHTDELPPGADGMSVRETDFIGLCSMIDGLSNTFRLERYRDKHGDELQKLLADRVEEDVRRDGALAALVEDGLLLGPAPEPRATGELIMSALRQGVG